MADMTEQAILEGHISIEAALKSGNRSLSALYVREGKHDSAVRAIVRLAQGAHVPVHRATAAQLDQLAMGGTHGGLVAVAGPRRYATLGDLLPQSHPAFIVMIDGVEDPYNFGYAIRALYAVGTDGLVVRPRNWLSAAGTVARASAGASEWMPTAVAETAEEAASFFRQHGLTVACTAKENAVPIDEVDLAGPLFLLIGGEKRGITRSFLDQADLTLQIPYGRSFRQSLGATSAAAMLGYEIMRQRRLDRATQRNRNETETQR